MQKIIYLSFLFIISTFKLNCQKIDEATEYTVFKKNIKLRFNDIVYSQTFIKKKESDIDSIFKEVVFNITKESIKKKKETLRFRKDSSSYNDETIIELSSRFTDLFAKSNKYFDKVVSQKYQTNLKKSMIDSLVQNLLNKVIIMPDEEWTFVNYNLFPNKFWAYISDTNTLYYFIALPKEERVFKISANEIGLLKNRKKLTFSKFDFLQMDSLTFVKQARDKINSKATISTASNSSDLDMDGNYLESAHPEDVFVFAEKMPEFTGGDKELIAYLNRNLIYPPFAKENEIEGTVYVNFIVERDGTISKVKITNGIKGGCNEEAMRLVKSMPKWIPGKQSGKEVRVFFDIPVIFKLQK